MLMAALNSECCLDNSWQHEVMILLCGCSMTTCLLYVGHMECYNQRLILIRIINVIHSTVFEIHTSFTGVAFLLQVFVKIFYVSL